MKKLIASIFILFSVLSLAPIAYANTELTVNSVNSQGWLFNADPSYTTPYSFATSQKSMGDGSLYVAPIGSAPADKFIASKVLNVPIAEFTSISYDFMIAGNGDAVDANQFYLNVYANLPDQ